MTMATAARRSDCRDIVRACARRFVRFVSLLGLLGVPLATRSAGQMPQASMAASRGTYSGLWGKNALGGQLGPWFSSNMTGGFADTSIDLTANSTAFHMEFFYQPHLTGVANLDLSVGAVSRGEMSIQTGSESSFGTATIYPIGLGIRLAPFARSTRWAIQPMIRLGGTVLVGTEQFERSLRFPDGTYYGTSIQSRWALGFYGGAGVAWVMGERFAMTACVKYQHARFTKQVFGAKDYSGIQVLVGAMYLYWANTRRGITH
jgi:hypothetical protein